MTHNEIAWSAVLMSAFGVFNPRGGFVMLAVWAVMYLIWGTTPFA